MARAAACPNCSDELDIPDELVGRPVRCASCGTVFTPAAGPPEVRPRRDDFDEDDGRPRPRRVRSDFRAKPQRGLFGVMTFLLLGTFGVCCLGCGGLLGFGIWFDNPTLQEYRDPDGRFVAGFPGPPKPVTTTLTDDIELTGVEHRRKMMGQDFDWCSVQFYDLPKAPAGDAAKDQALATTAAALVAGPGNMTQTGLTKKSIQGYPALEVVAESDEDISLYSRIILAGKRVYVVTYEGNGLVPESQRTRRFWERFEVTEPPAAPPKVKD